MESPLVSIIIPSYNREKLIGETLNSVITQLYSNWEVLVVDDGSTDNTLEVVKEFSLRENRIRLLKRDREPKGASACRNIGIRNAKGYYCIFLDSDDLLLSHCIENRVAFMSFNNHLDFAVFQMLSFDSFGITEHSNVLHRKENYLYAFLQHDLPWAITCPIWKVSFIKDNLWGYNEQYPRLQDPEFNTRALLIEGSKFHVLHESEADCLYRSHSDKTFNSQSLLIGFELYLIEFLEKTETRTDSITCKEKLKGSYIEAIRCFYTYKGNTYDKESIKIIKRTTRFSYKNNLIKLRTVYLTILLLLLYKLRINYLHGGKYLLRFNMKLIKTFN